MSENTDDKRSPPTGEELSEIAIMGSCLRFGTGANPDELENE